MRFMRPVIALHPAEFGRRPFLDVGPAKAERTEPTLLDDARLFAMTFAGGFLFVAIYLA